MISGVAEYFRTNHPLNPIQTVHDSLLINANSVSKAENAIIEEFNKIGLMPFLKTKHMQETNTEEKQNNRHKEPIPYCMYVPNTPSVHDTPIQAGLLEDPDWLDW